ncbi:uncharacterized [Tachysurus ichikawai]
MGRGRLSFNQPNGRGYLSVSQMGGTTCLYAYGAGPAVCQPNGARPPVCQPMGRGLLSVSLSLCEKHSGRCSAATQCTVMLLLEALDS